MGAIPLKAQSFSIPGGLAGTQATLRMMRSVALAGAKSPTVRTLALSIVQSLPPRDTLSEAKALFQWVRDRIRFVQDVDNVETVQTTDYTLHVGQGDCDDKTTLLAALSLSIGLPFRFVVVGNDPSNFCHVLGQVNAGGRWYFVEPSEPGPVAFGQQKRIMPASMVMDVSTGSLSRLGNLGDIVLQYGFDPFANPPQYNDLTKAQWDAFFSNVSGDAHDRLVTAALQAPSLQQAFYGMVTGFSDPFALFNTDPPPPPSMALPGGQVLTAGGGGGGGGVTGGGGTSHGMPRLVLQGLGAIPQTSWNWLYNSVKTGAAKAAQAWANGASIRNWDMRFNAQERVATDLTNIAAIVVGGSALSYSGAAAAGAGGTGAAGGTAAGASAIAPTSVAVDAGTATAIPTVTATAAIAPATIPALSAADIGTAASVLSAATGGAGTAATVASTAGTVGTVIKAATALVGADLAVKTAQAQIDAQQQQQQLAAAQAATALQAPPSTAKSKLLPLLITLGLVGAAFVT